ncbi:MAG: 5'-methylthioadenosine/adenosylhomocysteine nucleosidase [Kofleriaceae bacterium]
MLGIIAAMSEELAAIIDVIGADDVVELGGRRYYRGRYRGEPVIAVVSRIGKVAAATTTAILLERFQPRGVVMTGLAGAVDPRLAGGDIVIADRVVHHDLDARPLFARHEIPLLGVTELIADPVLADRLARAAEQFAAPPQLAPLGITRPAVWRGLVASGDQFFSSSEMTTALRDRLPAVLAVEMEGAAVAQVCHEHGVPFAIARVISDSADHTAAVDFARFLRDACGPYAHALIQGVLAAA